MTDETIVVHLTKRFKTNAEAIYALYGTITLCGKKFASDEHVNETHKPDEATCVDCLRQYCKGKK